MGMDNGVIDLHILLFSQQQASKPSYFLSNNTTTEGKYHALSCPLYFRAESIRPEIEAASLAFVQKERTRFLVWGSSLVTFVD